MKVFYEDENIIVCEKSPGESSEAGKSSLPEKIAEHFREKDDNEEVFVVHRLDIGARGIMVFARNQKAAAYLSKQIADGTFRKEYDALIRGVPKQNEGVLTDYLFRDKSKNKTFVVKRERKGVRYAELSYKTIDTFKDEEGPVTHVHIVLKTGRTHQIRVQFASRGMPLSGDRKYGAKDKRKELALVSTKLSFYLPFSEKRVEFETECNF
ncbi:MAG: RluA family pseudouridine synthase [Clostridia bacterium]|nr:RluA family pseudouridine synthase [Clostridia bacterium]